MENTARKTTELQFDFGSFEGFNYQFQFAINERLTADHIVNWDHDQKGEADFWPSGDSPGVSLVFKDTSVTAYDILALGVHVFVD